MIKVKHFICSCAIMAMVAFVASCGGSSGTAATGSDTGGTGTVTGGADDTSAASNLKSVDAVSVDLSVMDLSGSASASLNKALNKSLSKGLGVEVGEESMAGCQLNQMKDEAIRITKEIKIFQCYLGVMQDNLVEFVVPDGSFAYYSFTFPEDDSKSGAAGAEKAMKLKVGRNINFTSSMEMQMCFGSSQSESFMINHDADGDSSTNDFGLDVRHHFTMGGDFDTNDDGELSDDEKIALKTASGMDEWGLISGSVIGTATATGAIDSLSEIVSAQINAGFDGNWGLGALTFQYNSTGAPVDSGAYNVVGGYHTSQNASASGVDDSFSGGIYGQFDDAEGTAKYNVAGTLPGKLGSSLAEWGMSDQLFIGFNANAYYCYIEGCDGGYNFENDSQCTGMPPYPLTCSCMEPAAQGATTCGFEDSGTEHFTIASGVPIIAASSKFSANVADVALATSMPALGKTFGNYAWDCTGTFTTLDLTPLLAANKFATCVALETEAWSTTEKDSCAEKAMEGAAGDTSEDKGGGAKPAGGEFD